ncbi:MAG: hypothetical protein WBO45_24120 [Planctomycetota bacterium]
MNAKRKRTCVNCSRRFTGWGPTCSRQCTRVLAWRRARADGVVTVREPENHTLELLRLAAALEVAMPWERDALRQRIAELTA